jgi:FkbM family methyltransferase
LRPVLFEVDAREAARLREVYPNATVISAALSDRVGERKLYITRNLNCVSLLEPNFSLLAQYPDLLPHFEVMGALNTACTTYQELHAKGLVPIPDVIKIDTQGHEFEVLSGFGDLLQHCLGVELEAQFYPLYQGQKLLHDLIAFLASFGLVLRKIAPVPAIRFDGDIVEVDAFFTKGHLERGAMPAAQRWKLDLLAKAWELPGD